MQKRETAINRTPVAYLGGNIPHLYLSVTSVFYVLCIMQSVLKTIKKSRNFGEEVNGEKRFVVVCYFGRTSVQKNNNSNISQELINRIYKGSMSANNDYQKSWELQDYFSGESDYWSEKNGKRIFKAEDAYTDFCEQMNGLTSDLFDLFDISFTECAEGIEERETSDGNIMRGFHFAELAGTPREDVVNQARRAYKRMDEAGVFVD